MSRGADLDDLGLGLQCARVTVNSPVFAQRFRFNKTTHKTLDSVLADAKALTPGSVLVFNYLEPDLNEPGTPASSDVAVGIKHIGSVLRVDGDRVQFIDTGVLTGDAGGPSTEGGTADHDFTRRVAGVELPDRIGNDLVAVGVMPVAADLDSRADQLAGLRPWGVVRLVITEPDEHGRHTVRFISKLVHMRYPVSRLIWSLRGLPIEGLAVFWHVFAPHDTGSSESLKSSDVGRPFFDVSDMKPTLYLANVIRGDATGAVTAYRYKDAGPKGKGWFENLSGTAVAEADFNMRSAVNAVVGIGSELMKKAVDSNVRSFCRQYPTFRAKSSSHT